jgi:hypothetical protein
VAHAKDTQKCEKLFQQEFENFNTCFSSAAVSERCTNPNISVYVFKLDLFIDEISPKIENRN